jgi:hypothetical protein
MATWQAAQPGTVVGDGQGNYQIKVGGQWTAMPKGSLIADEHGAYHFDSDAIKPPDIPADPAGGFPIAAPPSKPDATATANAAANAQEHGPVQDVIDMIRAAPSGVVPALKGLLNQVSDPYGSVMNLAHGIRSVIANPDAALSTVKNATPQQVGKNVLAPAVVGAGVNELGGAAAALGDTTGAAATEAASPAGQLGLRSTEGRPIATTLAGPTAAPTLDAQNQAAAHTVLGADAGVPHGVPINPTSLEAARVAPGRVLDDGAASLPTAPLSPDAAAKVAAARGPATITKPTPNVAAQIDDIENRLLEPGAQFSGSQIRATRNSLSSDANAGMNSTDADTRAVAKYKRGIVDALDQHVSDTMPANSVISPEMIANSRATLAKNYMLQDLIGKGGDINLQALAKLHRDSPNLLTGNTRTVAQFASDHPEVTGGISDADRISPPGLGSDVAHINILNPRSWVQPLVGAAGRSSLRGGNPLSLARGAPVAGEAGEFNPIDRTPQPPAGMTATPPTAPPPAAAGPPGQIPLADLLSHGVEQPPAPGLQSGPMGTPAPSGMPFQGTPEVVGTQVVKGGAPPFVSQGRFINDQHVEGPETPSSRLVPGTLDELLNGPPRSYGGQPPSNADVPGVMSQGVPEDIVQRSRPSGGPSMPVAHSPAFISNNASAESAASQEAINRGTKPLVEVDPDGNERPILRDVTQADVNPARGHLIVDKETGTIVNSGGMAPALARGLLNRWKSMQGSLGGAF